jgi:hypothetical protein
MRAARRKAAFEVTNAPHAMAAVTQFFIGSDSTIVTRSMFDIGVHPCSGDCSSPGTKAHGFAHAMTERWRKRGNPQMIACVSAAPETIAPTLTWRVDVVVLHAIRRRN